MKKVASVYRHIAPPWICLTVYMWALELRAAVGTDIQPIYVWLADCAAILLTLAFWMLVFCVPFAAIGSFFNEARFIRINKYAVKAGLVAVTALHFVRWLLNWQIAYEEYDVGFTFLIALTLILTALAIIRRQRGLVSEDAIFPALEDCFSFAALPVLIGAVGLIGVRIASQVMLAHSHATAVASASAPDIDGNSPSNIILIISDAMRAQSMSLYGNTRTTTPNIERWARSATVFLEAHTNSTSTKPSMTTILTGKLPTSHGRLTKAQPPNSSDENLLRLMRDHGYFVGAVTSNEDASLNLLGFNSFLSTQEFPAFEFLTLSWLRRYGIYPTPTGGRIYQNLAQFVWVLGYPQKTSYYGSADDTLSVAKNFIAAAKRPFFLVIHLHEPHDPYDAPPPFRGMYASPSAAKIEREISSSHYGHYAPELQSTVDFYRDQYEESIAYLDQSLGTFFRQVETLLRDERYALIFTGDHGESFDRGYMNHGENLFESSTHVPLIIRFPSQQHGARLSGLVESVDIAPTILTIAGVAAPHWMDGQVLHSGKPPGTKSTLTLNSKDPVGQTTYPLPTQLAIWSEPYKLITSCESRRNLLFNLSTDPDERTDLSKTDANVVKDMLNLLRAKIAEQTKGPKISCPVNN